MNGKVYNELKEHNKKYLVKYSLLKEKHPDAIILMRDGDKYKTYRYDAERLKTVLGLEVMYGVGISCIVASFPSYMLDVYLPKLVRKGIKVAISDYND